MDRPPSPSTSMPGRPPVRKARPAASGTRHPARYRQIVITFAKGTCGLPGPRAVHHLRVRAPPAHRASPRDSRSSARRPDHPGQPGLPGPVGAARRRRGHHPPGRGRQRHAPRPLRGLAKTRLEHVDAATALNLIRSRLVEPPPAGPDPREPPRPPRTRPGLMNQEPTSRVGSHTRNQIACHDNHQVGALDTRSMQESS